MADDERATLTALDAARRVFRARIESRDGRVIDMAGDSVLAIFDSAKSAVKTALDIQKELKPAARVPADKRLQFRIGVHLGDVIAKTDGTIYGEGVNIAARLQTKAPPGGICLSQTVYDTVSRKLSLPARFGGRESFKNIPVPIPVWIIGGGRRFMPSRLLAGALAGALALALAVGGWYWTRSDAQRVASLDGKSVAVLPLVNLSEDKDLAYFADGLHEDLLTQLALLGDLKVVSRTSVMEYRGSKKGARQIGAELGVVSLVEGSVRRAGNQVRLTAQLVDTRSDQQVWAKSYDRELKDVFMIQSELATEIARALQVSLAPQEQSRLARKPTDNLDAYDLLLRHQDLVNRSAGTVRAVTTVKQRIALLDRKSTRLNSSHI